MPAELVQLEAWLIDVWMSQLASAVESMAGEHPAVTSSVSAGPDPATYVFWRQPFPPLSGSAWIATPAGKAEAFGAHVLKALGVEDAAEAEQRSTFQETLNQALAGLAQALTQRLKREVNSAGGNNSRPADVPLAAWTAVTLTLGEQSVELMVGLEIALTEAIANAEASLAALAAAPVSAPDETSTPHRSAIDGSKTFALLLEVELPVTVSFGRAQIPLKDVLKLTIGSIVELNRAVTEPVEIIVNNCIIARGEVVVVAGNYGVRVREIVSREQRYQTGFNAPATPAR